MTRQGITVLLLWLFPLLSAAGETLRGNSVLGGVKDDVASCFVADDVMKSSMRTVSLGVKTEKAMSLAPFGERGDGLVRSVVVSGSLRKSGPDYVVRIILKDRKGGERLILESYEELTSGCADELTFSGYGEETLLMDGVDADSIVVCVRDAEVRLDEVGYSVEPVSQVGVTAAGNRKRQVESIVERINRYNVANRKLWRAAVTDVSLLDYGTKKRVVGIADGASSLGIEYYGGGIFEMGSHADMARSKGAGRRLRDINYNYVDSLYVDNFSWRNRHGIDWLTPHQSQHWSDFCCAFASVGCLEALANLFYNQKLDLNMSEQYLINNVLPIGGTSGLPYMAAQVSLNAQGVCDSLSCPYIGSSQGSNANPTDYIFRAKTSGYANMEDSITKIDTGFDVDYWRLVKSTLMKYGPLVSGVRWYAGQDGGHAMTLYGWGTIHVGDTIRFFDIENDNSGRQYYTIIDSLNDYIGQNYWMFKDTYDGGFWRGNIYVLYSPSTLMPGPFVGKSPIQLIRPWTSSFVLPQVVCEDRDGDGYYNWGIGPKPSHCPAGVSDEPDGDDTDCTRGPLDNYGFYITTNPDSLDTIYINTQTNCYDTIHIYQHVVVQYGGAWGVYAPVTFHNGAKLIIQDGGSVECIHAMTNVDLRMDSGGTFLMDANLEGISSGKVIKATGKGFSIPSGGRMELYRGKITNSN